nr:hypothetical protein [Nitrosospira multiformis]
MCILPSIGIALYPDHRDEAQQLLRHADKAMYFETRNDFPVVHPEMPRPPRSIGKAWKKEKTGSPIPSS